MSDSGVYYFGIIPVNKERIDASFNYTGPCCLDKSLRTSGRARVSVALEDQHGSLRRPPKVNVWSDMSVQVEGNAPEEGADPKSVNIA